MHHQQLHLWQRYFLAKKFHIVSAVALLLTLLCFGQWSLPKTSEAARRVSYPIQHIVIMVKENRTFDNLFGTFPGADGATTYTDPNGKVHPLNHQPDVIPVDIAHDHSAFLTAYDGGKMDGFSLIKGAMQKIGGKKVDMADSQFYQSDIPNYWQYAQTFALPDHFFYAIDSNSFPNHLFAIAGTDNDVYDIPKIKNYLYQHNWGCDAPAKTTVAELHSNGQIQQVFPCFTFPTLGDLLNAQGISWKVYSPAYGQDGSQWNPFDAIQDIRNTNQWQQHVVDYSQFVKDAASGSLPTVSWLVNPHNVSDHPSMGDSICAGENWTVSQINPIMQNQALWNSTAIFLTWDDFGGLYDHVVPPVGPNAQIEYGFRAPLIVISPYAKPHYVDPTQYTFPAIVSFVETILGLPSLGGLDQTSGNLLNSFNFNQQPLSPLVLQQRTCRSSSYNIDPNAFYDPS